MRIIYELETLLNALPGANETRAGALRSRVHTLTGQALDRNRQRFEAANPALMRWQREVHAPIMEHAARDERGRYLPVLAALLRIAPESEPAAAAVWAVIDGYNRKTGHLQDADPVTYAVFVALTASAAP